MPVELLQQDERSYKKQPTIFSNKKRLTTRKLNRSEVRFTRNAGLGFKAPAQAADGEFIDQKCPFTGNVAIRGRILTGVVATMKMKRTITVRRDYLHFIKKYNRFEKRHSKLSAHMSPAFLDVELGNSVTVGGCRPLSKTVRFNVLAVKSIGGKKSFKKF